MVPGIARGLIYWPPVNEVVELASAPFAFAVITEKVSPYYIVLADIIVIMLAR